MRLGFFTMPIHPLQRPLTETLKEDRELALIALVPCANPQRTGLQHGALAHSDVDDSVPQRMAAVARYTPSADGTTCEFAVTVADQWQRRGLASLLMQRLTGATRDAGYQHMRGSVLGANAPMRSLMLHLGFALQAGSSDPAVLDYALDLMPH